VKTGGAGVKTSTGMSHSGAEGDDAELPSACTPRRRLRSFRRGTWRRASSAGGVSAADDPPSSDTSSVIFTSRLKLGVLAMLTGHSSVLDDERHRLQDERKAKEREEAVERRVQKLHDIERMGRDVVFPPTVVINLPQATDAMPRRRSHWLTAWSSECRRGWNFIRGRRTAHGTACGERQSEGQADGRTDGRTVRTTMDLFGDLCGMMEQHVAREVEARRQPKNDPPGVHGRGLGGGGAAGESTHAQTHPEGGNAGSTPAAVTTATKQTTATEARVAIPV